ncbi:unnamed protein product [Microthlaspi erraticum]|uniref:Leucine-rich repeat-containing N-terminal plant-type domain-containing protein n=1 Tax=Microthlaspi erraticum TaxID=1685480 RepID=A0A6D2HJM7_9BRAS|nr:unnamed protein product [Microthlaspi erraticum]
MYGLDLSSNQISGEIPIEIGNLDNVRCLNFSSNRLTGSIPYSISKLKDLESLDLSNNELSGNIPSVLANLDSLGYFNVSFNNFSGEIPFKGHLVTFGEKELHRQCSSLWTSYQYQLQPHESSRGKCTNACPRGRRR